MSCNEITHLPVQMGDLESLRALNVRRNLLVELPVGKSTQHQKQVHNTIQAASVTFTFIGKLSGGTTGTQTHNCIRYIRHMRVSIREVGIWGYLA